ncbi:MAG: ParB/RepB/Spo0J family partition protein [bacterium]
MPRKALGRGLEALIPDLKSTGATSIVEIDITEITPCPYQPRTSMDEASLEDLKRSISQKGVLQPIIVRKKAGQYEVIAGERRLVAAKMAGLDRIPAVIRQVSDAEALEIALVENLQREDLNPIDEARGYRQLLEKFDLTQEQLARTIGKDRSTVANILRLLQLPPVVRNALEKGEITVGHARALLGLEDQTAIERVYHTIKHRGLSVRQVETLVRRIQKEKSRRKKFPVRAGLDFETKRIEEQLMQKFATKVRITERGGHGKVEIEFYSKQDLWRIVELVGIRVI